MLFGDFYKLYEQDMKARLKQNTWEHIAEVHAELNRIKNGSAKAGTDIEVLCHSISDIQSVFLIFSQKCYGVSIDRTPILCYNRNECKSEFIESA